MASSGVLRLALLCRSTAAPRMVCCAGIKGKYVDGLKIEASIRKPHCAFPRHATATTCTNRTFATLADNNNNASAGDSESSSSSSTTSETPTSNPFEFDPDQVIQDLKRAALWNQGAEHAGKQWWDPEFCRATIDNYERHLNFILQKLQTAPTNTPLSEVVSPHQLQDTQELLSSHVTSAAFKANVKARMATPELSRRVRELERLIGSIGLTPLTDPLSLRLLEANGKAGNVIGRALSLLHLRQSRQYPATKQEFVHAVRSIIAADLFLRKSRNVFAGDAHQPALDNPTRWLDSTTKLANQMLHTYASTGRTGKALHFFYQVVRHPAMHPTTLPEEQDVDQDEQQQQKQQQQQQQQEGSSLSSSMPKYRYRRIKVRMRYKNRPPYYKVPSKNRSKLVVMPGETQRKLK